MSARISQDQFANLSTTYAYSQDALAGWTPQDGGAVSISPAQLQGLSALVSGPAQASTTDALGHVTRDTLDGKNQVLQEIQPGGGVILNTYDAHGRLETQTDALNRVTTYARDAAGYVTQQTFPDGNTRQYAYQSSFHALTTYTDQRGSVYTYTYDGQGHQTTATDPLGHTTTSTYSSGLLQTTTDALGHTTTYAYDGSRRLQAVTDALAWRGNHHL